MQNARNIKKTISDLEGASSALWNFAQSREIPCGVDTGLQWISLQIDSLIVELRENWDKLSTEKENEPPLKAVE